MGVGVISSNVSTKVNRVITGATTVNANCYAIVTYQATSASGSSSGASVPPINVYFGPAASIPATPSYGVFVGAGGTVHTATYAIVSGVEFINSP
jgi:hypothetical protein